MTAPSVAEVLKQRIRVEGPLSVADYMAAANAAYYSRGDAFGAAGDFVTAPDISQTFGELLGLWAAVTWQAMGEPYPFRLVECGPGRGTLMRDLLRATERVAGFHAAADIHLIESSPGLRASQAWALGGREVVWHDRIDAVSAGPAIVIANEFLDALPVRQIERRPDGWRERLIGLDPSEALTFVAGPAAAVTIPVDVAAEAKAGDVFEICDDALNWIRLVAARLVRHGGAALIVDYGHKTTALGETLQAVRRHAFHPVLDSPGEADLTAHVDFAALSAAAAAAGAKVYGPVEQGLWLRRLGIQVRQAQLNTGKSEAQARDIAAGVRRLIEPDGMGLLFKALAIAHPALEVPEGFTQDDA